MSDTFSLAPDAITNNETLFSLDDSGIYFVDGSGDHPAYDEVTDATAPTDSFSFGVPSGSDSPTASYVVTWGDEAGSDEVTNFTLDYANVTATQTLSGDGGGVLQVDGALSVLAGTIDLGNEGLIAWGSGASTFTLDGVLQGAGVVNTGPVITGSGTIIANHANVDLQIDSGVSGSISAEIQSGAFLDFGGTVGSGVTITAQDSSHGVLQIGDLSDFQGTVDGFGVEAGTSGPHDQYIDLTNIPTSSIVSTSIVNDTITIMGASGVLGTIHLGGEPETYNGDFADYQGDGGNGTALFISDTVCFVQGTHILTPKGNQPVETLSAGDEVVAIVDGQRTVRPVRWVGYRKVDLKRHGDNADLAPVRFKRGAMGENAPERDLLVSPPHCMFIDGKLIPAKLLVNDMTIVRDTGRAFVEYYHLELDHHAVVIAEGVESESYLDTGNRSFFANTDVPMALRPELTINAAAEVWATKACAPLAVAPDVVKPVWQMFVDRAEALGMSVPAIATTSDADIHLRVDGKRVDAVARRGEKYSFVVPGGAKTVELASRSVTPRDLVPYLDDPRVLGVAVKHISVLGKDDVQEFPAGHPALSKGWNAAETEDGSAWRWTRGCGEIPLTANAGSVIVDVLLSETTTYILDDQEAQRLAA